jgi:hypothetical protein
MDFLEAHNVTPKEFKQLARHLAIMRAGHVLELVASPQAAEVFASNSSGLLSCPHCGSDAEHESTITQEVIRCAMCPATMMHDGSFAALRSMWNFRT